MSHRLFMVVGVSALATMALAGTAQATFFSFASDVNSNAFTFAGTAGPTGTFTISQASQVNNFTLLIDDNNNSQPTLAITGLTLQANLTATGGVSQNLAGTTFQHSYRVTGTISFLSGANTLLTILIGANNQAVLTVPGTQNQWSTSGAVLGADSFADVTYRATSNLVNAITGLGANAAAYGIAVGPGGTADSVGPDDFAFTLTTINAGTIGTGPTLNANSAPTTPWQAESSYSGSTTIPTPASVALMGVAGLVATRRRR